jgi:hypothetical protein
MEFIKTELNNGFSVFEVLTSIIIFFFLQLADILPAVNMIKHKDELCGFDSVALNLFKK